ncbi:MAG: primase-like DNA-binding domain-containing protein, partial [Pseudomonadota bacterium]
KNLPDALRAELEGILAWAVRGCREWQQLGGLGAPVEVMEATQTYRVEMDVIKEFIEDCCMLGDGKEARASSLYKEYARWCKDLGENAMTGTRFGRVLRERGFEKVRGTVGNSYRGIGLLREPTQEQMDV